MATPEILLTGSGRCGTTYFANLLTTSGKKTTHEVLFSHSLGTSLERWQREKAVGESSFVIATKLQHEAVQNASKIVHLVRHPVPVIKSLIRASGYMRWGGFVNPTPHLQERFDCIKSTFEDGYPELKDIPAEERVLRTATYWIACNKRLATEVPKDKYFLHRIGIDSDKAILGELQITAPTLRSIHPKWYNRTQEMDLNHLNIEAHPKVLEAVELAKEMNWIL